MKHKQIWIWAMVLVYLAITALQSSAKELKVGFSFAKPPFVMAEKPFENRFYNVSQAGLGIEIDIFKAALAVAGKHTFKPVYVPYDRLAQELKKGRLDAAATVRADFPQRFYSQEFITFHNVAITKAKKGLAISSLEDLKGKRIVAWEGARFDLGQDFEVTVAGNPGYREEGNQKKQVVEFLNDSVDVLIVDQNIFKWWRKALANDFPTRDDVTCHNLFPEKTLFYVGFVSRKLRDDFDAALTTIKKDGRYDKIIAGYVD